MNEQDRVQGQGVAEYYIPEPWEVEDWDDDADPECSHTLECCCESCFQNYPERFWENEDGTIERIFP